MRQLLRLSGVPEENNQLNDAIELEQYMRRTRIAPLAAASALPAASASTGTAHAADEGDIAVLRTEPTPLTVRHASYGCRRLHRAHRAPVGARTST
ncbi:hypothetical protein [Streptomyces murinus]|uniref:hypothetical protein n=1 Tax=Streptomyces murinus TaxID=33900 RepID=UPI0018F31612|nr:hypothetical protein [Streptomyces murinus]WUD11323.1 hypothetical protein OG586_36320 [Streptomyces murinus]